MGVCAEQEINLCTPYLKQMFATKDRVKEMCKVWCRRGKHFSIHEMRLDNVMVSGSLCVCLDLGQVDARKGSF